MLFLLSVYLIFPSSTASLMKSIYHLSVYTTETRLTNITNDTTNSFSLCPLCVFSSRLQSHVSRRTGTCQWPLHRHITSHMFLPSIYSLLVSVIWWTSFSTLMIQHCILDVVLEWTCFPLDCSTRVTSLVSLLNFRCHPLTSRHFRLYKGDASIPPSQHLFMIITFPFFPCLLWSFHPCRRHHFIAFRFLSLSVSVDMIREYGKKCQGEEK